MKTPRILKELIDKIVVRWIIQSELRKYQSERYFKIRMKDVRKIQESRFFDANYYKTTYQLNLSNLSTAAYYTYIGFKKGHNPSPHFSGIGYYWQRTDVGAQGLNPLLHYEYQGCHEGISPMSISDFEELRNCNADYAEVITQKKHGKAVLLVSHEMSLTGAPRALFNLAITLKEFGVYSVFASLIPGVFEKEIKNAGVTTMIMMMQGMREDAEYEEKMKQYISAFDMILFNTTVALPFIETIKDLNITKVCWIHDGSYGFASNPYSSHFADLYPLFNKIFIVGDYARTIAYSYSNHNIEMSNLIYGIEDLQKNETQQEEHEGVVMVLAGTIEERKGQKTLLNSLTLLSHEILKQLKIYIIGKTLDSNIYDQLMRDATGCIEIMGVIPHEDVISHFAKMDILLCPSLDDPMPIVCTEAMMLSKPVIVSDHTGTASFIHDGENGFVVQAGNSQSLARAITNAVIAKNKLSHMGKRARKIFEKNFTCDIFKNNVQTKILPLLTKQEPESL